MWDSNPPLQVGSLSCCPLTLMALWKPPPELESGSLAYEASASPYMLWRRKPRTGFEPVPLAYKARMPPDNTFEARLQAATGN